MNRTLRNYMDRADQIHSEFGSKNLSAVVSDLEELESSIRQIQSISHRMAHIYNLIKRQRAKSNYARKILEDMKMRTFPYANDWRFMVKSLDRSSAIAEVAPGIKLNVVEVDCCDDIPNTPLYFIKNTQQFACQINGVLFTGNIGNIYAKSFSSHLYVNECKNNCQKKECTFYHNPKHGLVNSIRNYTSASWMYTDSLLSNKNKNMRHIGSRNTLSCDLYAMKLTKDKGKTEIQRIADQTMHDILVVLSANQCGLLTNNPDIKFSHKSFIPGYYQVLDVE